MKDYFFFHRLRSSWPGKFDSFQPWNCVLLFHDRRIELVNATERAMLYPIWSAEAYYNAVKHTGVIGLKKFKRFSTTFRGVLINPQRYLCS